MTTIELTLPDELVQDAQKAGLLKPGAIEHLLREELRKRAGEELRALWTRAPQEKLTPEIEQEIVAEVKAARAEKRQHRTS